MSELDDLVAVFGRIDDAVQHDPDLLPKVAAMLPPYRYGASGWYRPFREWQQEENSPSLVDHRDVGTALSNLQDPQESAPDTPNPDDYAGWATRHWINARRMLASSTLGRIQGNVDLPSGAEPHALVNGIADNSGGGGQQRLHDHLRTAAAYPNMEAWPDMMEGVRSQSLVATTYVNSTYVPPIASDPGSFRVVHSSSGQSIALRTHYHALDLELDKAERCLDPASWSLYRPPWCRMDSLGPLPGGIEQYREVISSECTQGGGGLSTVLNFRSWGLPDQGRILEYRLPENSNQPVSIDEGSLEIRPARPGEGGIHFVTTKRVQFSALQNMPTMPTAALGFLVWVLGWDTLAERFLYFLAQDAPPHLATDQGTTPPPDPGLPQDWSSSSGMAALFDLGLARWQTYVRDCVGSVGSSVERAASGNYGMADYLSDLTKLSTEVTNNTMAAASVGAQIYRSVASSDGPPAGGGGGQQPGQPGGPRPTGPQPTSAPNPTKGSGDVSE